MAAKVINVPELDLSVTQGEWAFAQQNKQIIEDHWQQETAKSSYIFNGKVLIAPEFGFREDGCFFAQHIVVDFAAFLTWRDLFLPRENTERPTLLNIFGSAVVVSSQNHLIMGVMGPQTSNSGLIYPASGMPDLKDVTPDNKIDVIASLKRELKEEMGLNADDASCGSLLMVEDGWRRSIAQFLHFDLTTQELKNIIQAHLETAQDDELSGVAIITSPADINNSLMPSYVPALINAHFEE